MGRIEAVAVYSVVVFSYNAVNRNGYILWSIHLALGQDDDLEMTSVVARDLFRYPPFTSALITTDERRLEAMTDACLSLQMIKCDDKDKEKE